MRKAVRKRTGIVGDGNAPVAPHRRRIERVLCCHCPHLSRIIRRFRPVGAVTSNTTAATLDAETGSHELFGESKGGRWRLKEQWA